MKTAYIKRYIQHELEGGWYVVFDENDKALIKSIFYKSGYPQRYLNARTTYTRYISGPPGGMTMTEPTLEYRWNREHGDWWLYEKD